MATPTALKGKVAASGLRGLKPLGYLAWFSVPDQQVALRTLKRHWMVAGLDPAPLPKDTQNVHTFKRAMRAQDGRHREDDRVRDNKVDIVLETKDDVVYQISTTVRDLDERVINYPKAMRVTFNKQTDRIGFKPLGEVQRAEVMHLMEAIQGYYDDHAKHITGAQVRTLVRNYLQNEPDETTGRVGLSGENLRGKAGGIYFIPEHNSEQLDALSTMLEELYKGGAYLHMVPMADTDSEREIIRRHHVANARSEMVELIGELKSLNSAERDRAPRKDSVEFQAARYYQMQRKVAQYKDLLGDELDEMDQMLRIAHTQVEHLKG